MLAPPRPTRRAAVWASAARGTRGLTRRCGLSLSLGTRGCRVEDDSAGHRTLGSPHRLDCSSSARDVVFLPHSGYGWDSGPAPSPWRESAPADSPPTGVSGHGCDPGARSTVWHCGSVVSHPGSGSRGGHRRERGWPAPVPNPFSRPFPCPEPASGGRAPRARPRAPGTTLRRPMPDRPPSPTRRMRLDAPHSVDRRVAASLPPPEGSTRGRRIRPGPHTHPPCHHGGDPPIEDHARCWLTDLNERSVTHPNNRPRNPSPCGIVTESHPG